MMINKKGEDIIENQYIKLSDLRKVPGIGEKTIERIKDMVRKEQGDTYVSKYDRSIHLDINEIYQGDCLELMNGIPDKSIDMILCDLPYGTTACSWDTIIPFYKLWKQYERIIKDNGAIVLFGSQPFTSALVMSNVKMYKCQWVWKKRKAGNFQLAKHQPLKITEEICVFGKNRVNYYPIPSELSESTKNRYKYKSGGAVANLEHMSSKEYVHQYNFGKEYGYPKNILDFGQEVNSLHPTQKPVALCEYLIKTYTKEGDLVLDNCIGSGTTAIAAINTNRNFIGIELQEEYYKLAINRVSKHIIDHNLQDRYDILV